MSKPTTAHAKGKAAPSDAEAALAQLQAFQDGLDRAHPKVRQILDAARRLFLEQPYDAVSTDAIAKAAKVSKATLYVYFPSKEALFAALVCEACQHNAADIWHSGADCADVELVLRRIARNFVAMFATFEAVAMFRVIVAQVPRFPELGQLFHASGPQILNGRIAEFLGSADARGLLRVPDPAMAARQFIALISLDLPFRGLLGLEPQPQEMLDALVDSGVKLFMAAYASETAPPAA